jgi:NADPH:quinone reductase-like Zn-dependent oxidoreductase
LVCTDIEQGSFPFGNREGVVPGSDGAGEVVAIGSKVTRFQQGSRVVTLFNQEHLYGSLYTKSIATGMGGNLDGTLRRYGAFHENGLVLMLESLTWMEAAALPAAALTA